MVAVSSGAVTPLAETPFPHDVTIYNTGSSTVYLSADTSVAQNPKGIGIPVPPAAYKDWRAGTSCFAICAGDDSSTVTVGQNSGLLTAPIGQVPIFKLSQYRLQMLVLDSYTSPYLDMGRFPSFSYTRLEYQPGGGFTTQVRVVRLQWFVVDPAGTGYVQVDEEIHQVYLYGDITTPSTMYLKGDVKAPYLRVVEDGLLAGDDALVTRQLVGYTQPVGTRSSYYSSFLTATTAAFSPTGQTGQWGYTGSIAAGATDTIYPGTYTGPASLTLRNTNTLVGAGGTTIFAIVQDAGTNRMIAGVSLANGLPTNSISSVNFYVPTSSVRVLLGNNTTVAITLSVAGTSQRVY